MSPTTTTRVSSIKQQQSYHHFNLFMMRLPSSVRSTSSLPLLLLYLLLSISTSSGLVDAKTITVDNGEGGVGIQWGPLESCPPGSRAIGYDTRNDQMDLPNVGPLFDDTALNAIRLYCDDAQGTNITSSAGEKGLWGLRLDCPTAGTFPVAFELRVLRNDADPDDDNTAANNIHFKCSDGRLMNGVGNSNGEWSTTYSDECATGICGIETKVKSPTAGQPGLVVDETALNDVRFECCQ